MSDFSFDSNETNSDSENIVHNLNSNDYQNTEEYEKFKINIKNIKNIISKYQEWKRNLTHHVDKCLKNLNNSCRILEDLINNKNDIIWENLSSIEKYVNINDLQSINEVNEAIDNENIEKEGIKDSSIFYLDLIKKYNFFLFNIKKPIIKIKKYPLYSELNIEKMKNMRLDYKNKENESEKKEYTYFSPLNDKDYMIFGNKEGEVEIYDFSDNSYSSINRNEEINILKLKLRIKVFNEEVKYICDLDQDLFAVSGRNNEIKIIKCEDNISKYSIIQTIYINDYEDSNIYSMISLPLFSSQEKKHFLCVATDKNILIFKSNKIPKYLDNTFDNRNNEENLTFELYKTIELYTLTHCLIEVNNQYLVASCPNQKAIKFFDMTNDFSEFTIEKEINVTRGSNIFTLIPNENKLLVACEDGFKIILIEKKKPYKSVHCSYGVLSLDMINENTFICCCSEKNKNIIKQYEIDKSNFKLNKKSERNNKRNDEIWKFQIINGKIFYIDNQKRINYLV